MIKNDTMEERQAFESKELTVNSKDWKQYEVILKSPRTEPKAHLRIFLESAGTVDLEHVSLSLWILGKSVRTVFARTWCRLYMISNPVFSVFPVAVLWKVRMRLPVTNGKNSRCGRESSVE